MKEAHRRLVGVLPVPAFAAVIAVFRLGVRLHSFYDPEWLISVTNTLFVAVVCFAVAFIALRNYRTTGRNQILLLGCGVLVFGIGGLLAGLVRGLPGGANLNVTIYNTGALVGALFHFAAALMLISGVSPESGAGRKGPRIASGYLGIVVFMVLLTTADVRGLIPPFFIQGQGPSALRQAVLGTADALFAFSFFVFLAMYFRNKEPFLYWYSLALALTSISLTAFFIEFAVGDPISWTGRTAQYLGGVYFLIAVRAAVRSAEARKTTFDNVLAASLSPGEEKFRALAEHSPDVIDRFDRDLRHIYVNPAGLRLHGKPARAIIGKTIAETGVAEPYGRLWQERIQKVFDTARPLEVEDQFPTADGLRFYQSRCAPEFGPDGSVANVLVISHDLTERRRSETVLQEAHDRNRAVLESIADGFFSVDRDWNFTYVNRKAASFWKKEPVELLGRSLWETVPLAVGTIFDEQYHKAAAERAPVSFEAASPITGAWVEARAYPSPDGLSVYFTDITARKQAGEALRESLGRFELLASTAEELLQSIEPQNVVESICRKVMERLDCQAFFNFLVDEKAGRLRLNACAGIPAGEARRIEWLDYGAAVCGCAARDNCRIVAEHIPTTPDERTELVKSYGIKAYACHPLLGPGGTVLGTLSFGTMNRETFSEADLSLMKAVADQVAVAMNRMRNEKALQDRTGELETSNKELEAFIYSVSHDLRAPLRSMAGFSKILVQDYADKLGGQCGDYLNRINNASEKMTRLIEDLLRLSRISRQDMDLVDYDLSAIVAAVVQALRAADPERNVEAVITPGLRASVDPSLMKIALSNLTENAWKFTSKTENARIEFGTVERGTRNRKPRTVYYISDNGAGFDPRYAERMFWPFHRLHSEQEFEGTGIGLAIVERVIRRHGGKVWAEGAVGKGATFFFTV